MLSTHPATGRAAAYGPVGHPQKLFYQINEVARLTGVKPYVLRYWETEFAELAPEKTGSNQRRYRGKDIQTVMAIRKLLYEDRFTIKGARRRLREEIQKIGRRDRGADETPAPAALAVASGPAVMEVPEIETKIETAKPASAPEPAALAAPRPDRARLRRELAALRGEVNELLGMLKG